MFTSKFVFFAALITQKDPGNLKAVCSTEDVQREIVKMCPEDTVKAALKSFSDSCAEAGQKVSLIDINKPTGTSGASNGDDSGSNPTSTSSGSHSTGTSAGYVHNIDSFTVAAVVALVGLVSSV
ncbi:GPI-anchored cell wall protein [Histoplasma capsulatum]|uniref:GPI-anchored cell wall protein n=1 Tax=Ajellomyces capsulatus TaxID=5037 RepID=A0A8A1MGM7_AJECA|nr:predicted protein [Histoplasma mississippiense (nom. inval.)]EDN09137.1 predicted protein [Histoplasma mississippiense (nom. inval.)]QSS63754.1 GPI-anchored cell wall protein [Histoplasma capsulatum]